MDVCQVALSSPIWEFCGRPRHSLARGHVPHAWYCDLGAVGLRALWKFGVGFPALMPVAFLSVWVVTFKSGSSSLRSSISTEEQSISVFMGRGNRRRSGPQIGGKVVTTYGRAHFYTFFFFFSDRGKREGGGGEAHSDVFHVSHRRFRRRRRRHIPSARRTKEFAEKWRFVQV